MEFPNPWNQPKLTNSIMPRKDQAGKKNVVKKKLTQGEKNKIKQANKAKANPAKAAKKKDKNNAKRAGRYVLSTPHFSFSSFLLFHFFASPDNGTTTLTLFYFDPVVFTLVLLVVVVVVSVFFPQCCIWFHQTYVIVSVAFGKEILL